MKTKAIYIGLIILSTLLTSCDYEAVRARGEVTSREVNFSDYSGLRVSDAFNVYIRLSESEEKIEIEANENLHDKIIVEMEGSVLQIKLKNHTAIRGNATMNAYISTKNLTDFNASGASTIVLESPLVAQNVKIELSGASEFSGELDINRLELYSNGASEIDLFGSAQLFKATLSGSSSLKNYDFSVAQLDISLSGASDAHLFVTESISIDASGASTLYYKGTAAIGRKSLSGASEIIKRD